MCTMCEKPTIDFEELGRFSFYCRLKSYTAPSFNDPVSKSTGKYVLDCCNIEYCKEFRQNDMTYACLMGATGDRCTLEEKKSIRDEAVSNGFSFAYGK